MRQGVYVFLDQGMMSVGMFLIGVLLARIVSKEEYAVYVLGWSVISIIGGIHRAMVVLPFTVYSPKMDDIERNAYQSSGVVYTIIIGFCAVIFLDLWASWSQAMSGEVRDLMVQSLPYFVLIPVPFLMREYMRSALFARLEFIDGAKINFIASTMLIVVMLIAVKYDSLNVQSAYLYIAAVSAIATAALIYRRPGCLPRIGRLWLDIKRNFKLGKWLLVNALAYSLVSQVYIWLLLYLNGAEAVAAFGACAVLATLLAPFVRAINAFLLPKLAHSHVPNTSASGHRRLLRVAVIIIAVPYLVWLGIGSVFAEQVMTFFYSGKYTGYGILFALLILKTTIESVSTPATSSLQSIERADVTTVSLVLGAVVAVTVGYFLIDGMGLVGAGIAACLSTSTMSIWRWVSLLRIIKR